MVVLSWIIIGILGIMVGVALVNVISAPLLKKRYPVTEYPKISVLIPARNEAETIRRCVNSLREQRYPDFEILVLDDHSTDGTGELLRELARTDSRIEVYEGEPLPRNWTGKNWACHQLSRRADGEIFLFTDADNWYHPDALLHTAGWIERFNSGMLSAFPQQITGGLAEKLVVPYIDVLLYSLLPLRATYYSSSPSLTAANGQWIAFRREVYRRVGGHQSVSGEIVEDTTLARRVKSLGERMITLAGSGMVYGRMYTSFPDLWEGFTKNLFGLTGYRILPFVTLFTILFLTGIGPFLMLFIPGLITAGITGVIMNVVLRFALAVKFRHPVLTSVVLHPVSVALTLLIGLHSLIVYRKGVVHWKGRSITTRDKADTTGEEKPWDVRNVGNPEKVEG